MAAGKKPAGNKGGRPKKPVDQKAVPVRITLPGPLYRDFESWREAHEFPPERSAVLARALEDFLKKAG